MGDTVFVNNRAVVHKGSLGKAAATFPDVCYCPPAPPAGPVPTPLPNTAVAADVDGCASTVFVEGNPIAVESSFIARSTGNEMAQSTGGGVLTGAVMGKAYFVSHSMDVLVEGKGVPRHLDLVTQNHACPPSNTPPANYLSSSSGGAAPAPRASSTEPMHFLELFLVCDAITGEQSLVTYIVADLRLSNGGQVSLASPQGLLAWDAGPSAATLELTQLRELRREAADALAGKNGSKL